MMWDMDDRVARPPGERGGLDLVALSEREREVLDLALTGLSARAIAGRLTLTEATIRSHLARIYAKLGVGGRVELLASLQGQALDRAAPSPSPTVEPAAPGRRRRWPVVAMVVLFATLIAGALFLYLRPDLPPATNLATVSQLAAEGQATNLDLRGSTLFVTTADGRRYRVEGVAQAAFSEIVATAMANIGAATLEVSGSNGDTLASNLASVAGLVDPVLLLIVAGVALVTVRRLRRPPQLRPAA